MAESNWELAVCPCSTLVCKHYHCTAIKNNYCTHTVHALTKRLKFTRVEVIQETQKSPFHFLDIWNICEKRMLDWCCLCPFCFTSWRFGFLFDYAKKKKLTKQILLPAFNCTVNLKCKEVYIWAVKIKWEIHSAYFSHCFEDTHWTSSLS